MTKFIQGQMIILKSNKAVEGAAIAILEGQLRLDIKYLPIHLVCKHIMSPR